MAPAAGPREVGGVVEEGEEEEAVGEAEEDGEDDGLGERLGDVGGDERHHGHRNRRRQPRLYQRTRLT